jgi:hypothetical protein
LQSTIKFGRDPKGLCPRSRFRREKQLNQHLNSDQIDELLQSAADSTPSQVANRDHLKDARRHLKECPDCQMRIRAHEQAIESLALLKPKTPGTKGLICPPDYIWLDIAAGILDRDAENDLSHAAQCDHCGSLLRQAKEDFADELTSEEETIIANLPSSRTAWHRRLAVKLEDTQASLPVFSPPKDRSPSFPGSLLARWRLAFAASIIGLILLGLRDYQRTAYLSAQHRQAAAEIQRLQQSILQQSTQIAELTAGLKKSSTPATAPEPQPTGNVQIASLSLDPGLTRGIVGLKRLTIPRGTDIAKITLHLLETPDGAIREDLITAEGQKKWSQELSPPESEKKTNSLTLLVPAYLLTPNDYQIALSRQSSDGFERFATYTFRVIR